MTDLAVPTPAVPRDSWRRRLALSLSGVRLPLRRRILLTFALGSFALSAFLAGATYGFTKSALMRQRDRAAIRQATANAKDLEVQLNANPTITQISEWLLGLDSRVARGLPR
ncbi:MAG: hypothetical protein R2705_20565 [Ilumatobacteraceae bacterium]